MRWRQSSQTALVGLSVLLVSCQDGLTEPDQPLAAAPRGDVVVATTSDPATVEFFDGKYAQYSFNVADNPGSLQISQPSGVTIARVPKFDPSLGELISARLVIDGWLATAMRAHGVSPFYLLNLYGAAFTARANPDPLLSSLIGQNQIVLQQLYSDFIERVGTLENNLVASGEHQFSDDDDYEFDQTYSGADAAMFIRSDAPGAINDLTLSYTDARFFHASASHVGFSIDDLFEVKDEGPSGAGTKPGKGTLIQLVASLAFQQFSSGHDLYYNDFHAAGAAQFQMSVIYTYQPNRPPVCAQAAPSVFELPPPAGRFIPVDVLGVTDPNGDPITIAITSIMQDEPTNASGDGNTEPDGTGIGATTAQVRAERAGTGDGRVYHIGFTAADGRGGACTGTVRVAVRHDLAHAAVDGGPLYDSTK
ncbi:MAG: hypothetical protein WEE89_21630 [Gemmatimonadota bacterium]